MEVKRGEYTFLGPKAEKSAHFYDVCMKMHEGVKENDPMLYRKIVWESAHKFGARVIGHGFASTRDGVFYGEKALEAAEFVDKTRDELFDKLPEYNRSHTLRTAVAEVIRSAEVQFGVRYESVR